MGETLITMHITLVLSTLAVLLHETVHAQMQFEIPQEMLGQMFGGGQQRQRQRQPKETTWPKWAKTDIAPEFQWLINTEWAGKASKREEACKWAANNGKLFFNTPTLGVVEFDSE